MLHTVAWNNVLPRLGLMYGGGVYIFMAYTSTVDQFSNLLEDTVLNESNLYHMIAGVLLILLGGFATFVAAFQSQNSTLHDWHVLSLRVMAVVCAGSSICGLLMAVPAITSSSILTDDLARGINSNHEIKSSSRVLDSMKKFICSLPVEYVCNDAPLLYALEFMLPLNRDRQLLAQDVTNLYQNETLKALFNPSDISSVGFRSLCLNQTKQIEKFGPALTLAKQYEQSCNVCSRVSTTSHPFPRWMSILRSDTSSLWSTSMINFEIYQYNFGVCLQYYEPSFKHYDYRDKLPYKYPIGLSSVVDAWKAYSISISISSGALTIAAILLSRWPL